MGKVVDLDPNKRFTKEEWKKFKDWVNSVEPDKIDSIYIAMFTDAGDGYESYSYGIDWKSVGYLATEVDVLRHTIYNEEVGSMLHPIDE